MFCWISQLIRKQESLSLVGRLSGFTWLMPWSKNYDPSHHPLLSFWAVSQFVELIRWNALTGDCRLTGSTTSALQAAGERFELEYYPQVGWLVGPKKKNPFRGFTEFLLPLHWQSETDMTHVSCFFFFRFDDIFYSLENPLNVFLCVTCRWTRVRWPIPYGTWRRTPVNSGTHCCVL